MKNKQLHKSFCYIVLTLLLLIVSVVSGGFTVPAFADTFTSYYTNVLDDLKNDEDFNADDYPETVGGYKVDLIQVAECENGILLAYVYQPMKDAVIASSINISKTSGDSDSPYFENYKLTLINSNGVFFKYRVIGFEIDKSEVRYYNVSSILRKPLYNESTGNDNTLNEVAFKVGKVYEVRTVDGKFEYDVQPTYVVTIFEPYHNYITVDNKSSAGNWVGGSFNRYDYTDLHYIAFSTDWQIDFLKSADVKYSYADGYYEKDNFLWWNIDEIATYGEPQPTIVTLNSDDYYVEANIYNWLWFHFPITIYKWDKIYSVADFCEDIRNKSGYSEEEKSQICSELAGKQWVLLFAGTERKQEETNDVGFLTRKVNFTKVSEVSVLRLEFDSLGVTYNLGTVSNSVSTPNYPDPTPEPEEMGFWQYIWHCIKQLFTGKASVKETIVAVAVMFVAVALLPLIMLILSLIFPAFREVLKVIFKCIGKALLWLLKGLWWLICLPFRGIKALVNKIRGE